MRVCVLVVMASVVHNNKWVVRCICCVVLCVCVFPGHKVERRELKGLDIVRRDWCGLAKTTGQ